MLDWFVYLLPVEAKDEEEGVGGSGGNALLYVVCDTIGDAEAWTVLGEGLNVEVIEGFEKLGW